MKVRNKIATLAYSTRQEVEPGVWENVETLVPVKCIEEQVYARRQDEALLNGKPITARLRIRDNLVPATGLDYVLFAGLRYKIRNITASVTSHYTVIELGELI